MKRNEEGAQKRGGLLKDIPKPHERYFDNAKRKREVRVSITQFPGGRHYYVTLCQEDNPIWNKRDRLWQLARDDEAGKGEVIRERRATQANTNRYIERMRKKFVGHEFVKE